jgi:hypothetical protein
MGDSSVWVPLRLPGSPRKRSATASAEALAKDEVLISTALLLLARGGKTPLAFEGFVRHRIRSSLCEKGWPWPTADAVAALVVRTALRRLGAQRPTWEQAQPLHVEFDATSDVQTECTDIDD